MAGTGSQGSLGLYFHRGKDRQGNKSKDVLAFTNKHVLSKKTNEDYKYSGRQGERKQYICNCGHRRFERLLNEALLGEKLGDAEQLVELVADPPEEEDADYNRDLKDKEQQLDKVESDVGNLVDLGTAKDSTKAEELVQQAWRGTAAFEVEEVTAGAPVSRAAVDVQYPYNYMPFQPTDDTYVG
ncbi:hypothetical protein DFH27DRAFT_66841 [Peziza echinospora]|nr:hypothetical protein DFH27DRAFT_66841 [Peziza echinospora]